jgi:hypothetical protein
MDNLVQSGEIVISSEIKDEVEDDPLKTWINQCKVSKDDKEIQQTVEKIVN